jgi:hypothetical protein
MVFLGGGLCRVQHGVPGVLRLRRRQVQLPEQRAVRHVGRLRLLQPGGAPQLGRHPPHRGRVQADHRRVAQRPLLPPGHRLILPSSTAKQAVRDGKATDFIINCFF